MDGGIQNYMGAKEKFGMALGFLATTNELSELGM